MKQIGIIRRIDDLGRIVIPKEIRKNMHIKKGELLEICVNNSDSIVLKKHSLINKKYDFLNGCIKKLSSKTNSNIYLTDLNKVIFSSNSKHLGENLSVSFDNLINNNLNVDNIKDLKITENLNIKPPFRIYPIYPNGDLSGVVILDYEEYPTKNDDLLSEFTSLILTDFFEED